MENNLPQVWIEGELDQDEENEEDEDDEDDEDD
jgi:hypothetical protein